MRPLTQLANPARVLVGIIILCALSCLPEPTGEGKTPSVEIPDPCTVTIADTPLTEVQTAKLRDLAAALRTTTHAATSKPDLELEVVVPGVEGEELISVWLEERFLYEGQYLDAWSERMQSDAARGFRIDDETHALLRELGRAHP